MGFFDHGYKPEAAIATFIPSPQLATNQLERGALIRREQCLLTGHGPAILPLPHQPRGHAGD